MDKSILKSIADTFNDSVYVYNGDQIQSQYNRLKNAFSGVENLQIKYACKDL